MNRRIGGRLAALVTLAVISTSLTALVTRPVAAFAVDGSKLLAGDAGSADQYGRSVAIGGNTEGDQTIVVGAYLDDDGGSGSGSAYVYRSDGSGGLTETKLTASDAAADDNFGYSVAIGGDTIVVGAWGDDDGGFNAGSAYVFTPDGSGGYSETKLTASDAAAIDRYGVSVAAAGDTIVVGAYLDDDDGDGSGAVYLYTPDGAGGYTETKLTPSDAAADDNFGYSVAADGDTIVVGAWADDDGANTNAGSAYVFTPNGSGGYNETKLTASDGDDNFRFGVSVAIEDEAIAVGAYLVDDVAVNAGAAYLYTPNGAGGYDETKLTASDGGAGDFFGNSVAMAAGVVIVGAPSHDSGGEANAGAVYLYEGDGTGGYREIKLASTDAASNDQYGTAVAAAGATIVSGAPLDDEVAVNAGSVQLSTLLTETKLLAGDGSPNDVFGIAVDEAGGTVIVGAALNDQAASDAGAAYVYTPTEHGRYLETKLLPSDGAIGDQFGIAVTATGDATSNTMLAVGARLHDGGTINSGAVYLYTSDGAGGYTESKLTAGDDTSLFGHAVASSGGGGNGTILVVGARSDDDNGVAAGAAYVYTPDGVQGWNETKLIASDGASNDVFGSSVAVAGSATGNHIIVVGAPQDDPSGTDSGSLYVYTPDGSGGYDEIRLSPPEGGARDNFGHSVGVIGDATNHAIIAGAYRDDYDGLDPESGSAYLYVATGPGQYSQTKLTASDSAATYGFGWAVDIAGDVDEFTLAIGATRRDRVGATYVYVSDGEGGLDETILTSADGAGGDAFGHSVAVSNNNTVVVGAAGNDDAGSQSGSAYVYAPPWPSCFGQAVTVDLGNGDTSTAGDDVILGTSGADVVDAGTGDDVVCSGDGDDLVIGGGGDDVIFAGRGDDTVSGNAGNDLLVGGPGRDRAFGGSGADVVLGGDGNDLALGGSSGADVVRGGGGNDTMTGGSDADIDVSGGDGNDAVNGGGGPDGNVHGDAGDDTVSGNGGDDVINGDEGNDEVRGGPGDDTVNGNGGNDFVAGNDGIDTCDGGTGTDTAASNCETALNVP